MKLIPRSVLFGNPNKYNAQLSPDGRFISFIAPKGGISNIWVAPADNISKATCVSDDRKRGIVSYHWSFLPGVLIYSQDQGGNENYALYKVYAEKGKASLLVGGENFRVDVTQLHHKQTEHALISMNDRDPRHMDYYKLNLATGERTLAYKNEAGYSSIIFDSQFKPRVASIQSPDASDDVLFFNPSIDNFEFQFKVPFEDTLATACWCFSSNDKTLIMSDSRDRDTAVLRRIDTDTGQSTILAEHPKSDASGIEMHPSTHEISAVIFNHTKKEWIFLDPEFQRQIEFLQKQERGELSISSRTLDDKKWLVIYSPDDGTPKFFLYEIETQKLSFLFETRPELRDFELSHIAPHVIRARDGLELVCYLTQPQKPLAKKDKPNPMVLVVHGGPWSRDSWGFNSRSQWLADRGYTALSVNFRGSTGFGKTVVNAGNKEWAGKMHDDLLDACQWTIDRGIADPKKIAILGASYGGYAALVGLTFTPDFFACAIDIVGPSNINTLLATIPPYWETMLATFKTRVGDFTTEEGRKFLYERSPVSRVDKISKPLLILQGANDPRVKKDESDQIYKAMKAKNLPVEYVVFPDEGHGFQEPRNNVATTAFMEKFLETHLGGRIEAITDEIQKSSAQFHN
jgi:dipeptidyl aminopeptidase/acylaminoacyl peptidase